MVDRLRRLIVLSAAVAFLLPQAGGAADNPEIVSIAKSDFVGKGLGRAGLDLLMERGGRVYVVAEVPDILELRAAGVDFVVETGKFPPYSRPEVWTTGGINGAYHSAGELEGDLLALERDHPDLAKVYPIGQSLEGRTIYALKISDNPFLDEGEPAILFLGCHHAREWISVEIPYLFGKHLVESYAGDGGIRSLVDRSEIWIVPLVNPDGLEYSIHTYRYWRKNRRANPDGSFGIDLNRNYGYQWGYDNEGSSPVPSSYLYRGPEPFSEPETVAVRDLVLGHGFGGLISFHSYSQIILYPWGYIDEPTSRNEELESVAREMSGHMESVRGTVYRYGRAADGLYLTNGDTADWSFGAAGILSYTIELPPVDIQGGGFFNPESEIEGIFSENLPAMLYLVDYAVLHAPLSPPARIQPNSRREAPILRLGAPRKIR